LVVKTWLSPMHFKSSLEYRLDVVRVAYSSGTLNSFKQCGEQVQLIKIVFGFIVLSTKLIETMIFILLYPVYELIVVALRFIDFKVIIFVNSNGCIMRYPS